MNTFTYIQRPMMMIGASLVVMKSNVVTDFLAPDINVCKVKTLTATGLLLSSQVNTNGIISFRLRFTEFRPQRFPLNDSIPLIAPFWDDVDIRRFGNIFYRETSNTTLLQRAHDLLQELFPSSGNFTPTTLFIATWDRLGHWGGGSEVYITVCLSLYFNVILPL